jgi:response regulator RpfG family c-di-GMP phosphodiesterase
MPKILLVDDDDSMRGLMKKRLSDIYQVVDTNDPEQALGLALEHKPDAILLDLMMPKFSGFELCQSFHTLSYTSLTPLFVITGESAAKYKEHCENLGATAFFEKPVDFAELKRRLAEELQTRRVERRSEVRVRMRVMLKLKGTDGNGQPFEESVATENVSASGFLCNCTHSLTKDSVVEVWLVGGGERLAGTARVVRKEAPGAPWQRYGFQFVEKTREWVLHKS